MKANISRTASFLIILAVYAVAFAAGFAVYRIFKNTSPLLSVFLADVTATLIVWAAGVIAGNSSVYDPYWSIAPLGVLALWLDSIGFVIFPSDILFIIVILIWSARLTGNWAKRWKGIAHEDWRYAMYKDKSPKLWILTNLLGINLMPTILVFAAMIPVGFGLASGGNITPITGMGAAIAVWGVMLEFFADLQMDAFRKREGSEAGFIDEGLWAQSRHPNYFGEISFWWGVWIMQMGLAPSVWYTVAAPILITLLFVFISIPMMEKHILSTRPDYAKYKSEVPMLVFFLRRKSGD
jgi:steroid 5-alpha reductase family enzyme